MSGTMNGYALYTPNNDSPAARCLAILERGMERLGMKPAPARMNKILVAPAAQPGTPVALAVMKERKAAFVADWLSQPEEKRVIRRIAPKHSLGHWPARHALEEAGIPMPRARRKVCA